MECTPKGGKHKEVPQASAEMKLSHPPFERRTCNAEYVQRDTERKCMSKGSDLKPGSDWSFVKAVEHPVRNEREPQRDRQMVHSQRLGYICAKQAIKSTQDWINTYQRRYCMG
jgi:hypothetical protein